MLLREGRTSLAAALILVLRMGLPVTAFFVAFNPIWGFSWYFNTESWATGVYQKMTQLRVDPWRVKMTDAITRAYGGGDDLFRIEPGGLKAGISALSSSAIPAKAMRRNIHWSHAIWRWGAAMT
jgi:hypothetical protein